MDLQGEEEHWGLLTLHMRGQIRKKKSNLKVGSKSKPREMPLHVLKARIRQLLYTHNSLEENEFYFHDSLPCFLSHFAQAVLCRLFSLCLPGTQTFKLLILRSRGGGQVIFQEPFVMISPVYWEAFKNAKSNCLPQEIHGKKMILQT